MSSALPSGFYDLLVTERTRMELQARSAGTGQTHAAAFTRDHRRITGDGIGKETTPEGARWVDARVADDAALARWGIAAGNAG